MKQPKQLRTYASPETFKLALEQRLRNSSKGVVVVNVPKETASLSRPGFGTILIAGYHKNFTNRVRSYSSITELEADGFKTRTAALLTPSMPSLQRMAAGTALSPPTRLVQRLTDLPRLRGWCIAGRTCSHLARGATLRTTCCRLSEGAVFPHLCIQQLIQRRYPIRYQARPT